MVKDIVLQNNQEKIDFYKETYLNRELALTASAELDSSFVEFLRKGYVNNETLFYYNTKQGKEIDFVVKNLTSVTAIYLEHRKNNRKKWFFY